MNILIPNFKMINLINQPKARILINSPPNNKTNFYYSSREFINCNNNNNLNNNDSLSRFTSRMKEIEAAQLQSEKLKEKLHLAKRDSNESDKSQSAYFKKLLDLGVNDININAVTTENLESSIQNLNTEQKQIYDEIINQIDHQNQHNLSKCKCENKPIRMFCSGVAGKFY